MKDLIEQVEANLQRHEEFGNSRQIIALNLERYKFALAVLARDDARLQALLPAVEALDEAVADKVFGDLLVRAELEAAIERMERSCTATQDTAPLRWSLERSLAIATEPTSLSAAAMARGFLVGPAMAGRRIWVWDLPEASEPTADALREALRLGFMPGGHCEAQVIRPTPRMVEQLDRACGLLHTLVPQVAHSVFSHLHSVAIAHMRNERGPMLTASGGDSTPCMIFIAPEELANPWDTAVHIMHEAVHLKLSDMVRASAAVVHEEMVTLPWGREISISNCLFAFHAYVHLQVFRTAVEQLGPALHARYGAPQDYLAGTRPHAMSVVNTASTTPFSRGQQRMVYLGEQFRTQWSRYLTPSARRMVDWLCEAIAPLIDMRLPIPPSPQAAVADEPAAATASAPPMRYGKNPALHLRPLESRGILFAADPAQPRIRKLNTAAWLMFELCDGRDERDLAQAYARIAGIDEDRARRTAGPILGDLLASGMIVPSDQAAARAEGRAA